MTISITIPGAVFTKFVGKVLLPYVEDAVSFQLYGGTAALSLLNRAVNATIHATEVGAPSYEAGSATVSIANGFNTGFLLNTPLTQVVVALVNLPATNLALTGRGAGNADNFYQMTTVESGKLYGYPNGAKEGSQFFTLPTANFAMMGSYYGGTGTMPGVFYHDGAALNTANQSVNITQTVTPTNNMRIGSGYGTAGATAKVAASVFYNRVLSVAELREVHDYLKLLLASRGVVMA